MCRTLSPSCRTALNRFLSLVYLCLYDSYSKDNIFPLFRVLHTFPTFCHDSTLFRVSISLIRRPHFEIHFYLFCVLVQWKYNTIIHDADDDDYDNNNSNNNNDNDNDNDDNNNSIIFSITYAIQIRIL